MADAFVPSSIATTVTPNYSNTNPVIYHLNMVITMSRLCNHDIRWSVLDGAKLIMDSCNIK